MKFGLYSPTDTTNHPAINLIPPQLTGTVLIGLSPVVLTGTWSKPTEKLYSLYRDSNIIYGLDKVPLSTIESYQYGYDDIGPSISVAEFALQGGTLSFSSTASFDHAAYLTGTAIWVSHKGISTQISGSEIVVDFWQSTYGGLTCCLSSSSSVDAKPIYNLTGVLNSAPALIFDGTDDYMQGQISKGSSWTTGEYAFTGYRILFTTLGNTVVSYAIGSSLRYGLRDRTTTVFYNSTNPSSLVFGGTDVDPDLNYSRWWATRQQSPALAEGGHGTIVNATSAAITADTNNDNEFVSVGGLPNGTCTNIAVRAVDFGIKLDPTRLLHLRALLQYLVGGPKI